jgi:polyisoprenyl-phosphate glycosyltransferase
MVSTERKTISIITPAYNEEACIPELLRRIEILMGAESAYDFQAIVIDNGSVDGTGDLLTAKARQVDWLEVVTLSRNFDIEGALLAGLDRARGDAVVFMNADLEDPPELVSTFLREWERGSLHVVGEVTRRASYSRVRQALSKAYYAISGRLTAGAIEPHVSDFRLIDRVVYENLRELRETQRINRGLIGWLGFPSVKVPYERPPRFAGESRFRIGGAILWGSRNILNFTVTPLRLVAGLGAVLFIVSLLALVVSAVQWVLFGVPFAGYGSVIGLILLLFGLQFIILGVFGEYLSIMFLEIKARPRYIVQSTVEGSPSPQRPDQARET